MRCYSNFFLISTASFLNEFPNLQQIVLEMIETTERDHRLIACPDDFADNFGKLAEKWAKRMNFLKVFTGLVRQYKAA